MENDRLTRYAELVRQRKACHACDGLTNPATLKDGNYDCEEIGAWSLWQGNLNAKLLVVGQDWGDIGYAEKFGGRDDPNSKTNQNLVKLLSSRGYEIVMPDYRPNAVTDYFFTNGILCLKGLSEKGGMQGQVKPSWFRNCGTLFLRPMIELVGPKILVSLGKEAYRGILGAYGRPAQQFQKAVEGREPLILAERIQYYPVYHCSAGSINRNRCWDQQMKDWTKIPQASAVLALR